MADRNPHARGDQYNETLQNYTAQIRTEDEADRRAGKEAPSMWRGKPQEGVVRINNISAVFLTITALMFDAVQAFLNVLIYVPVLGLVSLGALYLVAFCAWIAFGIWFAILRVNYFTGKQMAMKVVALFAVLILGSIPVLSFIPELTAGVLVMILATRIEDTVGNKKQLTGIADKRVATRDKMRKAQNDRLKAARESGKEGADKKAEKKSAKETKQYDRKVRKENFDMVRRVASGTPKRPVDGMGREPQQTAPYRHAGEKSEESEYESEFPDELERYDDRAT
jgi:hypothetical protein